MMELVCVYAAGGITAIGKQIKMAVRDDASAPFRCGNVTRVSKLLEQMA